MGQSIAERLESINWEDLLARALLYATHQIRINKLEGKVTPEDLVLNAITDLITGRRDWPTDVTLLDALTADIKSEIAREKYLQHRRQSIPIDEEMFLVPERATQAVADRELMEKIFRLVSDDAELIKLVEAIFEIPDLKPSELAAMLNITTKELYTQKKRLRRKLSRLINSE